MKENQYYVYMFWRADKQEIFYIGKGKGNRRLDRVSNRNDYFKRICSLTQTISFIYKNNLSEDEAFELEKKLIAEYRMKGLAYCNFHEGGRGGNVFKYDGEERKLKMIKKCRLKNLGENNPMYKKSWKEFSTSEKIENHKRNVSKAMKKLYEEDPNKKKQISKKSKEMWNKPGHKEKYRINNSRKVYMYSKDMEYIRNFASIYDALDFLGLKSHTTLLKAIRLNKIYKNYYWKREEQKGVETIEILKDNLEKVE